MTPLVEILARDDVDAAAAVLGRAFRENPMNVAVIGGDAERRERCNRAGVEAYLPAALEAGPVWGARCDGELRGVLVSMPPGAFPLPVPNARAMWRLFRVQGFRVMHRFGRVAARLLDLHPAERHWTLATLGVDPVAWRRGCGRELLFALTEHVSETGLPIYLDTDRVENIAFYGQAGFEVLDRREVEGVTVHRMLRPAP